MASMPGYVWDSRLRGGRYRVVLPSGKLGKIVSASSIAQDLRTLHAITAAQYAAMVGGVFSGEIAMATFQLAMMAELKSLHVAMSALGAGGWNKAGPDTWGRAGNRLRREYAFLAGFVNDLKNNRLSETEARSRAELYADNAYGAFWKEYSRTQKAGGITEERLIVIPDERLCPICSAAADRGWIEVGTLDVPQHLRCRCEKDYR